MKIFNPQGSLRTEFEVINNYIFKVVFREVLRISSQRSLVVNPFFEPLSPAERLAAQQRDHEKLQRERQLRELAEAEAKARGAAVKRPVGRPCMLLQEQASHRPSRPFPWGIHTELVKMTSG